MKKDNCPVWYYSHMKKMQGSAKLFEIDHKLFFNIPSLLKFSISLSPERVLVARNRGSVDAGQANGLGGDPIDADKAIVCVASLAFHLPLF